MANGIVALAGLGGALAAAWLVLRRKKVGEATLTGGFGITPSAVVFAGLGHTQATVSFTGTVTNTANASFNGSLRLQVFSDSPLPIADRSISVSVLANDRGVFSVTAPITETMLAGDVTAAVTLLDGLGNGLQTIAAPGVLATIQQLGGQSVTGQFGID